MKVKTKKEKRIIIDMSCGEAEILHVFLGCLSRRIINEIYEGASCVDDIHSLTGYLYGRLDSELLR